MTYASIYTYVALDIRTIKQSLNKCTRHIFTELHIIPDIKLCIFREASPYHIN